MRAIQSRTSDTAVHGDAPQTSFSLINGATTMISKPSKAFAIASVLAGAVVLDRTI